MEIAMSIYSWFDKCRSTSGQKLLQRLSWAGLEGGVRAGVIVEDVMNGV